MTRKKIALFFAALFFTLISTNTTAQETITIPDTLDSEWYTEWIAGLNGSQSTYDNWAAGGQNNVAATVFSKINGAYQKGKFKYGYVFNFRYGITNIEGEDSRKTDDRIATVHRIAYILNDENTMNMFAEVSFVTQFYDGYDYSGEERVRISDFMAPGYFTQSIGYAYTPYDFVSFEAGLGLKQTIVSDDSLVVSPGYGIDLGENLLSEGGLNLGISFNREILPNVTYTSRMETFNNLKKPVVSTDFKWANELSGRINSFMTATFTFEMIYDDDVVPDELQTKQVLGVGVLFNLK